MQICVAQPMFNIQTAPGSQDNQNTLTGEDSQMYLI
jgi:hypothetical protein